MSIYIKTVLIGITGIFQILLLCTCLGASKKGNILKKGESMQNGSFESLLAENVNFDSWKDHNEGEDSRFHVNFCINRLGKRFGRERKEIYPLLEVEKEVLFRSSQYRFVKKGDKKYHLMVEIFECNSISAAREKVFLSLNDISRPLSEEDFQRPRGYDFGDVYKFGFWSRDNIFISLRNINGDNDGPVLEVIKELNEAIDDLLLTEPHNGAISSEGPDINHFEWITEDNQSDNGDENRIEELQKGSETELKVVVENSEIPLEELFYTFFVPAGQIVRKDNRYFYKAEKAGTYTLKLYVEDKFTHHVSLAKLEVTVR